MFCILSKYSVVPVILTCKVGIMLVAYKQFALEAGTVEGGELGRWCELGQNFSDSSPLLLLVKRHWCAMGRKCSAL